MTDNPFLARIMESIGQLARSSRDFTNSMPRMRTAAHADHERIVAALRARDPEAARAAMADHLKHVERTLAEVADGTGDRRGLGGTTSRRREVPMRISDSSPTVRGRWRVLTAGAAAAVAAVVLAACGGGSDDDDSSSGDGSSAGGELSSTLTTPLSFNPGSLDPDIFYGNEGLLITTSCYDGLLKYKNDTTEIEPALAESYDVSEDGKT